MAEAMNAADKARKALGVVREEELEARLDLPKKPRAYLAAKDVRREALKVRRQAFKARARAAGLYKRFISSFSEKKMTILEEDAAAADAANAAHAADPKTATSTSPKSAPPPLTPPPLPLA